MNALSHVIDVAQMSAPYKLIDTRFQLNDPQIGRKLYNESHIEQAIYWDLNEDLSDMALASGRHPMPSHKQLQSLFERSGLYLDDVIYIYDQGAAPFAFRAWFLLTYAGFKHVKVINGGYDALVKAGFLQTTEVPIIHSSKLSLYFHDEQLATKEDVKAIVSKKNDAQLIDARSYKRYIGEEEPIDAVAGHIPTAINFDWEQLVQNGMINQSHAFIASLEKDRNYVVYCGSGVSAVPLYATLLANDFHHVKLYVGSFSDWITSEEVASGDETKK